MLTQTPERQELLKVIGALPDDRVTALLDYAKNLQPHIEDEWVDPIEAGKLNAKTMSAIQELDEGGGIKFETTEELFKHLDS